MNQRRILYVPGMKPKPPAEWHERMLLRCLLTGLRRTDPVVAAELETAREVFSLVPWPHLFYTEVKDTAIDAPGLDRLLALPAPEARDIEEARHWQKQLARFAYLACDALPWLTRWIADPNVKATLQDSLRYLENRDGIAARIRELVAEALQAAAEGGRPVLLIAHSLGSVIAWDVLWSLSRQRSGPAAVDFLTLGSPLGLNFFRHRLLGARAEGRARYPDNIRHWINLSAIGELTALDRRFADDYAPMLRLGLLDSITDETELYNYFRGAEGLNVHKCYGYLVNPHTAAAVADWWRRAQD
ncbi:MAG: hypothetical protein D6727_03310 [Gammaproteobacteria bacterium]|nr:MAG: hypothetical protein D6727_03310 [Gammaproteobacteria bacterium]